MPTIMQRRALLSYLKQAPQALVRVCACLFDEQRLRSRTDYEILKEILKPRLQKTTRVSARNLTQRSGLVSICFAVSLALFHSPQTDVSARFALWRKALTCPRATRHS